MSGARAGEFGGKWVYLECIIILSHTISERSKSCALSHIFEGIYPEGIKALPYSISNKFLNLYRI